VAPDYVLILRSAQDAFVEAIKDAAAELRLDGALMSDSFASIVSENHYKRLRSLMTRSSGNIVVGGNTDDENRRITPTVYRDVKEGDALLEGYILRFPFVLFTGSSLQRDFWSSPAYCPCGQHSAGDRVYQCPVGPILSTTAECLMLH